MLLDVIAIIIILFFMFLGFKQGFFQSLLGIVSWVISFVMAYVWLTPFKSLVKSKTSIYENILGSITEKLSSEDYISSVSGLPEEILESFKSMSANIMNSTSISLADIFFNILCFVSLMLIIKILLFLIIKLLSSHNNNNIFRLPDAFLGMILGFFKGFLVVLLVFALFVPVIALSGDTVRNFINESVHTSKVAGKIYERNIIINFSQAIDLPNKND